MPELLRLNPTQCGAIADALGLTLVVRDAENKLVDTPDDTLVVVSQLPEAGKGGVLRVGDEIAVSVVPADN